VDRDEHPIVLTDDPHGDLAVGRTVLKGVVDQVGKHLALTGLMPLASGHAHGGHGDLIWCQYRGRDGGIAPCLVISRLPSALLAIGACNPTW
jgi:hypothetical protein